MNSVVVQIKLEAGGDGEAVHTPALRAVQCWDSVLSLLF